MSAPAVMERVDAGSLRETVEAALHDGARFGGAWATAGAWRVLLCGGATARIVSCDADRGEVESIAQLVEAANWDEREAHDLRGLTFAGHLPMRALAEHTGDLRAWTIPVTGADSHQVAVGPIHAGVIESGHFRFHVVGERILAMDPRLFYKHRGLERAAEGRSPGEALAYVERACAACAAANTVAYAQAVEGALGLWPDEDLRRRRTLLLELERLYNHLHDIGALCAGVGFAPGTMAFATLKDRAQEVNGRVAGHRFLFGAVTIGGGSAELDAATAGAALAELRSIRADAAAAWRELEFAASVQARLDGVGVLLRDDALRLGAVGPAARAAGVRHDVRTESPRLAYAGFAPAALEEPEGDVRARLRLRAAELETTCDLLEELLSRPIGRGTTSSTREPCALGIGRVESPRGATMCAVELGGGGQVTRLRLRTGSYANWPALAHATAGNLLPDFPLINKSFELCYACVDR